LHRRRNVVKIILDHAGQHFVEKLLRPSRATYRRRLDTDLWIFPSEVFEHHRSFFKRQSRAETDLALFIGEPDDFFEILADSRRLGLSPRHEKQNAGDARQRHRNL
jgi:hypothetical protein